MPIHVEGMTSESKGSVFTPESFGPEDELEMESVDGGFEPDAPSSPLRSLLGSLGSLIWIGLLIAFSLAGRTCGGE